MKKLTLLAGGMMVVIALIAYSTSTAFADIVIKSGSTMKVSNGTSVVVTADVTIENTGTAGTLTIAGGGSLSLNGDFTNDGTADLGDGDVVFEGTAAQSIAGTTTSEFGGLEIDNSAGVSLAVDAQVDGTMTLTDGVLDIDASNLTFGTAGTAVAGSFDATHMILADNTGQVRKAFADGTYDPATFLFPIGSNDGTAEYTPVEIDFSTSTFLSGSASVNVTSSTHSDIPTAPDFLQRYWSLSSSGITNIDCDLSFTFVDADVTGIKANLYTLQYVSPSWINYDIVSGNILTASNVSSFSDWSGASELKYGFDLKVFLEGPYQSASDEMGDNLNLAGYIPLSHPFNPTLPYFGNPSPRWLYSGTESVGSVPADVVDWVQVQVRHASSPDLADRTTILASAVGFLKKDGSVTGLDGTSKLTIDGISPISDNMYVVIYHRNHAGIISNNLVAFDGIGEFPYDFTSSGQIYLESFGAKQIDTSPVVWGLLTGDGDADGNIFTTDADVVWFSESGSSGYRSGDYDMDGNVFTTDKDFYWFSNSGSGGQTPGGKANSGNNEFIMSQINEKY